MTASIIDNTLYRFRTLNGLLEEYEELENQSIFFAPPKLLNDPMEGLRLVHFKGDEVLWNNFFKHYLLCLLDHTMGVAIAEMTENEELVDSIRIGFNTSHPPVHVRNLYPEASIQLTDHSLCKELVNFLANHRDEVSEAELIPYLTLFHHLALFLVLKTMKDKKLIDNNPYEDYESTLADPKEMFQNQIQLLTEYGDDWLNEMADNSITAFEEMDLLRSIEDKSPKKWQMLSSGFPRKYLQEIKKLMYGNWYTACFMTDPTNSSVWGNYADKHTGVCLIYDVLPPQLSTKHSIMLGNVTVSYHSSPNGLVEKKGNRTFHFYDIDYESKPTSINFFENLGKLPQYVSDTSWFTFQGVRSKYSFTFDNQKREEFWDTRTTSLTQKSKDWEYENEKRLILDELIGGLPENGSTFTYDFKSLKGMIFGINTPNDKKSEIYKIVERKVKENKHSKFKFYQAYYCAKSDTIQHKELTMLNAKLSADEDV